MQANKTKVNVDIGGIESATALIFNRLVSSDLHLMSVATVDELVKEGNDLLKTGKELVVVAFVGADLHIRIFNADKKQVIDIAENKLVPGDKLTNFKILLTPFPVAANLSIDKKQKIIEDAKSISAYIPNELSSTVSLGYQPDINWWGMQNGKTASKGLISFLFSTDAALEGASQFWLPKGFYIGEHPNRNKIDSLNYDIGVLTEDLSKHRIGDIILNDAPVLNDPKRGFAGYMCVVDNGEKKWAGFGKLELLP